MNCQYCDNKAISKGYCKEHFISYFEEKVNETITEFNLLKKSDSVVVAASGGKDSMTLLFLLKKFGYNVTALAIDEGIKGYRDKSLEHLQHFCTQNNIILKTVSFEVAFGKKLDTILEKKDWHPCSVCGTFRRYLLNKHANGFDAIATGHNADDESQAVLMNLTRANIDLFPRGGPVTTSDAAGFVKRVKPLYFCTEKEILTYALFKGLNAEFSECPNVPKAYRATIRDALNDYEVTHPGTKENILRHYLAVSGGVSSTSAADTCPECGEPSQRGVCKACRLKVAI